MNAPVENEAIGENDDAILTQMLENVVDDGTGKRAALDDRPVAGKTGTTENYGDAWFVGYTPQLAVAVWVGYPNKLVSMDHQFEGGPVAGGTYPAVIWNSFVKRALRRMDEEPEGFPVPTYGSISPVQVVYRDNQWLVDNGNCRTTREVLYVVGFEPDKRAQCKPNEVDVPPVVGLTIDDAEARLYGMPLTPELITRPAKTGERIGVIVEQFPKSGTLSSWSKVRIVTAQAMHGRVPKLVGLTIQQARKRLLKRGFVPEIVGGGSRGEEGLVVRAQRPKPGRAAGKGMTIRLTLGPR